MASPIKIAKYLVDFYQIKEKRKELFVENVGKIWRFESTEEFLKQNSVLGMQDWSKKEQNVFVNLLKDSPYRDLIVEEYNRGVSQFDTMNSRNSFFKKISSISELLKAPPYNEGEFAKDVIKKCVELGFDGDGKSIDLMKKSLSLFVDRNTINDFISDDSEKKKRGFDLLKGIELADKTKEMNSSTLIGVAAIASLGVPSMHKLIHTASVQLLTKGEELVGKTGAFGAKIVDMFNQYPSLSTFAIAGASMYLAYKGFKELHKITKEFYLQEKEKYVAGVKIEELETLNANGVLSQKILGTIIRQNPYDVSDGENQRYVALCCFAVDKLNNPKLEVPKEMIDDLELTKREVAKLNQLTYDEIHEIALINNPVARRALLINDLNDNQKNTLKTISLIQDIGNLSRNPSGKSFTEISKIKNISHHILDKVDAKSSSEKAVLQAYMNIYTNSSGYCLNSVLKSVHGALNTEKPIENQLLAEALIDYNNMPPEIPRNEEMAYFKRVWSWMTSKEKRVENTVNPEVKDLIGKISDKYNLPNSQEVNNVNQTLKDGLINIGVDMKDGVIDKINKLKEKFIAKPNNPGIGISPK